MHLAHGMLLIALALAGCMHAPAPPSSKAPDSSRWTEGWQPFALPGKAKTVYTGQLVDQRWVLHAKAERSASMYRRSLRIEPEQLGTVSFSWKVRSMLDEADVRDSDTEDAVVRVLLAFDGDSARLSPRTRMMFDLMQSLSGEAPPFATLMYVWDNHAPVESVLHSPRSDRIRKLVLDSGEHQLRRWRTHRRQLSADYRRAFGEEPGRLLAVALMTDADNTRSKAEAWYSDVLLM